MENGICGATFCESAALRRGLVGYFSWLALSVKSFGFARFPLLSLTRHLPPARGKSFLKVGALGSPRRLHLFAKASPFDRLPPAGGRCRHRRQKGERGGTAIAMTERASLLKIKAPAAPPPGLGARVGRAQMLSRADHLFSGRGNRIRRVHQLFSQWRVMLPPCCWAAVRRLFRSGSWSGRPSGPSSGGVSV